MQSAVVGTDDDGEALDISRACRGDHVVFGKMRSLCVGLLRALSDESSHVRNSIACACRSVVLTGTVRIVGRVAVSAIASASE